MLYKRPSLYFKYLLNKAILSNNLHKPYGGSDPPPILNSESTVKFNIKFKIKIRYKIQFQNQHQSQYQVEPWLIVFKLKKIGKFQSSTPIFGKYFHVISLIVKNCSTFIRKKLRQSP